MTRNYEAHTPTREEYILSAIGECVVADALGIDWCYSWLLILARPDSGQLQMLGGAMPTKSAIAHAASKASASQPRQTGR
jgi:hypothetical protein